MVERYSWRRKDLVDLKELFADKGYDVEPILRTEFNGKSIHVRTVTDSLTVKSDNVTTTVYPTRVEVNPLEKNELTHRDDEMLKLICEEYRWPIPWNTAALIPFTAGIFGFMRYVILLSRR